MTTSMASHYLLTLLLPLLPTLFTRIFAFQISIKANSMYPMTCSDHIKFKTCDAFLYHTNNSLQEEQIAFYYSVPLSEILSISHAGIQDYLVKVPCSCKEVNGNIGYFYDASYKVQPNDTFEIVSGNIYSGQALQVGDEEKTYIVGNKVPIHLLCGCIESKSETVVTYTVQSNDTLSLISTQLSSTISGIESLNRELTQNPDNIGVGWVLFVPMDKNGIPASKEGRKHKWTILISILATVTILSISTLIVIVLRRNRSKKASEEDPKAVSKSQSANRVSSLQKQFLHGGNMEDVTGFESERPVIFSIQEIEDATNNFDEARKIGEGGYGSVYYAILGEKEVAIKRMRSSKSKEFFAELKVLCRIHHINVVELLGYSSGDDHLYLVYEYVQNGSLADHLHDPLLKRKNFFGHQPLSWTARSQIALDAARGIEYIHDHTKACYVHRDIKTSNILLDEGLRGKVADFGLAKLVGRSNEEDLIATCLVGTPGYLPPESVKELQVTTKTDVFAFGVVLAELITGQRPLIRDNKEPNKLKSLITVVKNIFQDKDPQAALEAVIDAHLNGSYPTEDVYKMAEIAEWCLSEDPVNRPEMQEIVVTLSHIMMSSVEWEASLGGNSLVFSGIFNGR